MAALIVSIRFFYQLCGSPVPKGVKEWIKRGRKIFGSILGESLLDGSLTPEQLAKAVQAMKEVGNKFHVLTAYRTLINKKSKLPTLDEIREEITSRVGAKFRMPKSTIHYILSNVYKLPCRGVGRPW